MRTVQMNSRKLISIFLIYDIIFNFNIRFLKYERSPKPMSAVENMKTTINCAETIGNEDWFMHQDE